MGVEAAMERGNRSLYDTLLLHAVRMITRAARARKRPIGPARAGARPQKTRSGGPLTGGTIPGPYLSVAGEV